MNSFTRKSDFSQPAAETAVYLFDDWFDPIEAGVRDRVREFIQAMVEGELDSALMRPRYGRRSHSLSGDADGPVDVTGHRHGHRSRSLMGTFGQTEIEVPRARLDGPDGKTTEWKSKTLRAYQRRTLAADALIASTYPAGTNTRRVRRALAALFGGAVGKDTVLRGAGGHGHGEPGVAEGEGRLGGLDRPLARRGADRAADPRRDRGAGPARPQGHFNIIACRHRRARGWPESIAGAQEHGWRDHRGLACCSRRPGRSRPTSPCLPHRGRCAGAGKGNRRGLGRRAVSQRQDI